MKATGIVRRIDDLGRVVIPKEIRKTLRIKEGTPLEIFTDREGEIILKKYSPIGEPECFCKGICRGAGAVKRDGSVYHRSRSGGGCCGTGKQGICGKTYQQSSGRCNYGEKLCVCQRK